MNIHTLVPSQIRRRYSVKITSALVGVVALTFVIGGVMIAHVVNAADGGQVPVGTAIATLVGLLLVFVMHLGIVGIVLGGNVSLALRQLSEKADRIGAGDLDVDLETDREDELGDLYEAFVTMRDSLQITLEDLETQRERALEAQRETQKRNEALIAEAERFSDDMAACAGGNLNRRLYPETDDEAMNAIADSFNAMITDLGKTIARVQEFARTVDEASTEVETGSQGIRQASEDVAATLQEISDGSRQQTDDLEAAAREVKELSASVEELTSTTSNIAEQSRRVALAAKDGRADAVDATKAMNQAEALTIDVAVTIRELNRDADQIGEVIELIDEIAEQTNMLALNASLESARSQTARHGRRGGFDVVADEVKQLATETKDAVEEIERTLESIRDGAASSASGIDEVESQIGSASAAVNELRSQFEEIAADISRVDEGIQTIDQATGNQATSSAELTTIIDEVSGVSAETTAQAEAVAAASEEATATSVAVTEQAESLNAHAKELTEATTVFDTPRQVHLQALEEGGD